MPEITMAVAWTRHVSNLLVAAAVAGAAGCDERDGSAAADAAPAAPVDPCKRGRSIDPSRAELRAAIAAYDHDNYEGAAERLERLRQAYPESATVRVWRGEVAMMRRAGGYVERADNALDFYAQALALHERGCRLDDPDEYALRIGIALAHLRKKDGRPALEQLRVAEKRWSSSAEVHYNLARAHCGLGEVDACAASFEKTLELARALERPTFVRNHNSLYDWIRRSKTQSEFPNLRADPRYARIVREATSSDAG